MLFPASFSAPHTADLGRFGLRLLAPEDTDADYRAVMASAPRIRGVFGPDNQWPPEDLSLASNTQDLERHLRESLANQSFAYSIWCDGDYAGCLYIKPFKSRLELDQRRARYRELCFLWVAEGWVADEPAMYAACHAWVASAFPVNGAAWPGRELTWDQWSAALAR